MLDQGDEALLEAPIADFDREMQRLKLPSPKFVAVLSTNSYLAQSTEADLADLRAALRKTDLARSDQNEVLRAYEKERSKLATYQQSLEIHGGGWVNGEYREKSKEQPPVLEKPDLASLGSVPSEFTDYLLGTFAWRSGRTNEARAHWEALLDKPVAERHYRSTWAAYMLGRYWREEDPEKALSYYRQVRTLASAGFADRLGLAAASYGWEAQVALHRKEFERAIQFYLQQMATGDDTAVLSLRFTASAALRHGGETLAALAANPVERRVITAFIISRRNLDISLPDWPDETSETNRSLIVQWLEAVEAAGAKDVDSAEQLALAAYQAGQWPIAQRWIDRARGTPVTQWLQAKLLLRAGKVGEAARLLERVARAFPISEETDRPGPIALKNNLYLSGFTYVSQDMYAPAQVLAETGVFHLARREYTEALDALLRSGFWMDAAYVAERVLTLSELKNYVDQYWPAVMPDGTATADANSDARFPPNLNMHQEIRYLLARRMTRAAPGVEARDYYPAKWQPDFDRLMQNLSRGWDESLASGQRAAGLFEAAKLARSKGMELFGTEVEPDWHIHDGQFEYGVSVSGRSPENPKEQAREDAAQDELELRKPSSVLAASRDELDRAARHTADPEERFHYRYQAAFLGLEAAKLMPDNSEETARVLCIAGSWLKNRDPDTADIFYKTLVRRCRRTLIGDLADRMRWFPVLDETGNPVSWNPDPPMEVQPPEDQGSEPAPAGYWYVLRHGNSLQDVIHSVGHDHQIAVTEEEVLRANPGLSPNRLKFGQRIFVPSQLSTGEVQEPEPQGTQTPPEPDQPTEAFPPPPELLP